MTTSPLYLLPRNPSPLSIALPAALTEVDADRIAAAIAAARTESTRRVYAYTWVSGPAGALAVVCARCPVTRPRCVPT